MPILIISPIAGIILIIWAIFLAKKHRGNRFFQLTPWLISATWLGSTIIASKGMIDAFALLETAAPDQRAAMLARGISAAMNPIFISGIITAVIFVYMVVINIIFREENRRDSDNRTN